MTRETRIGLLVGLGFIVAFGLVLSEITGSGNKPSPTVQVTDEFPTLSVAPVVDAVVPAATERMAAAVAPDLSAGQVIAQQTPVQSFDNSLVQVSLAPPPVFPPQPDVSVVPSMGELASAQAPQPAEQEQQLYTVVANDSLIKIARKHYGQQNAGQYMRIYEANKHQLKSPSTLRQGQKLVIPLLAAKPAARPSGSTPVRTVDIDELQGMLAGAAQAPAASPSAPQQTQQPAQAAQTPARGTYKVRQGDTLSRIARKTLNSDSTSAIQKLYDANRSKLRSVDDVPVGVELVIPT